ncbi:MAG: hypothetical protein H6738_00445 [Alphaproteobacteria bacterium]|nr:hypothetical protein [Alphaproteobacteria bacterium]MCB9695236.1 hypothetical protein [Alphaproteobacteria bacterium]
MADRRPRNQRPRRRGGKGRLVERAVIERQQRAIGELQEELTPEVEALRGTIDREQVVARIRERATTLALSRATADVSTVVEGALDEIFGLGPLEPPLRDAAVRAIRIDGPEIYVHDEPLDRGFRDAAHARRVVDRILAAVGRDLGRSPSGLEVTMVDGSTVRARLEGERVIVDILRP